MRVKYKPHPDWPLYLIGSDGSVWSIRARGGNDRRPNRIAKCWKRKAEQLNGKGYSCVTLNHDGKHKTIVVAHLVLEAFVSKRPPGMEACHFPNRSRTDNRLCNLRWDTPSGNQQDRKHHGTVTRIRGEDNVTSKLKKKDVVAIIKRRLSGESYKSIADDFDISDTHAMKLCLGRSWKHLRVKRPKEKFYAKRKTKS